MVGSAKEGSGRGACCRPNFNRSVCCVLDYASAFKHVCTRQENRATNIVGCVPLKCEVSGARHVVVQQKTPFRIHIERGNLNRIGGFISELWQRKTTSCRCVSTLSSTDSRVFH